MNLTMTLIVILLFAVIVTASELLHNRQHSFECGPNEEYNPCGTICPATCQYRPVGCTPTVCIAGCFCKPGFIRAYLEGECVPEDSCSEHCRTDQHEYYDDCGLSCIQTCANPNPGCDNNCAQGCFCNSGYIYDTIVSQKCIKIKDCS